jgi:hypothetical protein
VWGKNGKWKMENGKLQVAGCWLQGTPGVVWVRNFGGGNAQPTFLQGSRKWKLAAGIGWLRWVGWMGLMGWVAI